MLQIALQRACLRSTMVVCGWLGICAEAIVSLIFVIFLADCRDNDWMVITVVRLSWAMDNDLKGHFERVRERLSLGAQKLREMVKSHEPWKTADVPNVTVDQTFANAPPPLEGDK